METYSEKLRKSTVEFAGVKEVTPSTSIKALKNLGFTFAVKYASKNEIDSAFVASLTHKLKTLKKTIYLKVNAHSLLILTNDIETESLIRYTLKTLKTKTKKVAEPAEATANEEEPAVEDFSEEAINE